MHELANLVVDLRADRFSQAARKDALAQLDAAGFSLEEPSRAAGDFLAWIDVEFGGSWSAEAFAGKNIVIRRDGEYAGFATVDARLPFAWLRGVGASPDTGIFGPFGVARRYRGGVAGAALLTVALCALARLNYARALIAAVGDERLIRYYRDRCGAEVVERFFSSGQTARSYRTVVLASGSGSNFQSVIDATARGELPLDIALLLSNRPTAFALERARTHGIAAAALPWDRKSQSRSEYDASLLEAVRREDPDLVLLLGWMHILDATFIDAFPHMINVHPAYLPLDQRCDDVVFPDGTVTPAFRGAHAVRDALAWGSAWVGASIHRVTLDADRGPVLVRKPMPVSPGEAEDVVLERLHPLEHTALRSGILRWVYEQ